MARINGVELKAVKKYTGHEGVCAQGNVYYKGKKLGFWSQDSWGGPDEFDFDKSVLDKAAQDYQAGFPDTYKYKDYCSCKDVFLYDILKLRDIECDLNKGFRKGYKTAIYVTDGYHISWIFCLKDDKDEELIRSHKEVIDNLEKTMFKDEKKNVFVFRQNDFDMTIDADHPAHALFMAN